MATIRKRGEGVWEVRVFSGRDPHGKPKQVSKTVRGSKRAAEREAAKLTVNPPAPTRSQKVSDQHDEWILMKSAGWAALTLSEYLCRADKIKEDLIGCRKVSMLKVSDIDRFVARSCELGDCVLLCSRQFAGRGSR